jgi:NAD(P)H-dependent FMN reductase
MNSKLKIAIVIGTTRPTRFADRPTEWIARIARSRRDAEFEIVDLRDYPMPFFEEKVPPLYAPVENEVAQRWVRKMASFDGYIFITAEYNHSISGVLKNALDYLYSEVHRKPAAFIGYGGVGGSRAVEHLRHILAEMQMTSLKHAVHIGMVEMLGMLREGKDITDYPHLEDAARPMLDDLVWWATALKSAREVQQVAA